MTDSMALRGSSPGLAKELELLSQDELRAEDYPALERTVWRKLDRWILPFCAVYYLLSFLVCLARVVQVPPLHSQRLSG